MYLLLFHYFCARTRLSQILNSLRKPEAALRVSLYAHNCCAHTAPCRYRASSRLHFFVRSESAQAPTPRAIVGRLEEEMKNRPKDIARWVAPVSSNPQDETGLGSAPVKPTTAFPPPTCSLTCALPGRWHKQLEARPHFGHNRSCDGAVTHFVPIAHPLPGRAFSDLPRAYNHECLGHFLYCCGDRGSRAASRVCFEVASQ
jgi:hypothetical protein